MNNVARPQMRNRFAAAPVAASKDKDEVEDLISNARLLAERAVPSFLRALRVANTMITEDMPTAAVDQYWRVYWNPHFTRFLKARAEAVSVSNPCPSCGATSHHPLAYIAGTWVHEVGHPTFEHRKRFEAMGYAPSQHRKWNIVADCEMDDDIPEIGKVAHEQAKNRGELLPQICLDRWMLVDEAAAKVASNSQEYWAAIKPWDASYSGPMVKKPSCFFPDNIQQPNGWIAENYFEAYEEEEQPQDGDQGQPGQQGNPGGQGQPGLNGKPANGQGQPGQGGGQPGNPFPKMGQQADHNDHGSGVCGDQRPWEDGTPGEGGNAPGVTEAEGNATRRDVASAIKKAKAEGKGHIPGGWEVFADSVLQTPKVRWQDRLRAIARQAIARVRGDRLTTYRRLSRSSIVSGCKVVKPSTYEIVPTVVIVCDTSGSMGSGRASRLERALSEAEAILKMNKVKGYFLDCDANVYGKAQDVKSVITAKINGGGGTDMRVGVKAALKQKVKPDIVVLLTDGDTSWPSAADVKGTTIITGIVHERDTNGCPAYMNPVHIDLD